MNKVINKSNTTIFNNQESIMSTKYQKKIARFVFIGGCPRSGTSLVQKILDLNTKVSAGPEFDHLPRIANLYNSMIKGVANSRQLTYYSEDELTIKINNFIMSLFDSKLTKDISILSEKTPDNIFVFDLLLKIFPLAKFVFVVRDPRGVYSSFKEVKKRSIKNNVNVLLGNNIIDDINLINRYIDKGNRFYQENKKICKVIHYEELLRDSEGVVRDLCEFIGVDFQTQMLETQRSNQTSELIRKIEDITGFYTEKMYDKKIDLENAVKWKNNLTKFEKGLISYFFNLQNHSVLDVYNFSQKKISQKKFKLLLFITHLKRKFKI